MRRAKPKFSAKQSILEPDVKIRSQVNGWVYHRLLTTTTTGPTMHSFTELVDRCAAVTLHGLKSANESTVAALETSSERNLVKMLQMIELQKVILAVGMFSIFEAHLQDGLACKDGFVEVDKILGREKEIGLQEEFDNLYYAINVLKHGKGASYEKLVGKSASLPFKLKLPGEAFFEEGDVSEVATLIQVDDEFVLLCADVIRRVSEVVIRVHPGFT